MGKWCSFWKCHETNVDSKFLFIGKSQWVGAKNGEKGEWNYSLVKEDPWHTVWNSMFCLFVDFSVYHHIFIQQYNTLSAILTKYPILYSDHN